MQAARSAHDVYYGANGLAAINVGGTTIHSFAGIGFGTDPIGKLIAIVRKNREARERWLRCKTLIIDEISMLLGGLFDKLEELAREIRVNPKPFGGIQLVLCGDFFQLPPVMRRDLSTGIVPL